MKIDQNFTLNSILITKILIYIEKPLILTKKTRSKWEVYGPLIELPIGNFKSRLPSVACMSPDFIILAWDPKQASRRCRFWDDF